MSADSARTKVNRSTVVVRHSSLVLLLQVALLCCALANNFLVARMVGPQGKGVLYTLQLISGGIGLPALHFCLGFAAIYFLGQDRGFSSREVASGILLPSFALGLLPAFVLTAGWPWMRSYLTVSFSQTYLWLAVFSIPLAVLTFNMGQFSLGQQRIGNYNLLAMAPAGSLTLFLVAMIVIHRALVLWLVVAWFSSIVLPAIYAAYIGIRETGGAVLPNTRFLCKAFQFGWRSHLGLLTQQLQHRLPVLLVAYFLPISELGIYSLAVSIAELLWYFPNAISTVLMPHIASSTEAEARRGTPTFCRIAMGVTCVLAVGLSVVTTIVVPWLLPGFRSSLRPFYILMPGVVLATIFRVLASDFNGRGQPLRTFHPAFAALLIEAVAGLALIPRFGLTAAALVTTGGYAINSFMYSCSYRRLTGVEFSELLIPQKQDFVRLRSVARDFWSRMFGSQALKPIIGSIAE